MTQRSWFWGGVTTGDAALPAPYGAPYTDDMFSDIFSYLFSRDRTLQGVVGSSRVGFTGNLDATYDNSEVTIATGIGLCDGKLFTNDAAVALSFPGDGEYYVVLQKSWVGQTVRLAIITTGALTQTDGATWEVPLHYFVRTGGTVTSYQDRRDFVLRSESHEIPYTLFTATATQLDNDINEGWIYIFPEAATSFMGALFTVPYDYNGGLVIKMFTDHGGAASDGHYHVDLLLHGGAGSSSTSLISDKLVTVSGASGVETSTLATAGSDFVTNLRDYRGMPMRLVVNREYNDVLDTCATSVLFHGFSITYASP